MAATSRSRAEPPPATRRIDPAPPPRRATSAQRIEVKETRVIGGCPNGRVALPALLLPAMGSRGGGGPRYTARSIEEGPDRCAGIRTLRNGFPLTGVPLTQC